MELPTSQNDEDWTGSIIWLLAIVFFSSISLMLQVYLYYSYYILSKLNEVILIDRQIWSNMK
jgi:hypothetical protein